MISVWSLKSGLRRTGDASATVFVTDSDESSGCVKAGVDKDGGTMCWLPVDPERYTKVSTVFSSNAIENPEKDR
ncbi:hypothetical protein [Haloarcula nitratireducens]|uniref:Uncharacterized protein n=1 Tax=Haloarcula nitratireducens TaxID=2487749 RepID=A0AAW4PFM4_9EURY|nr:hypothetical protein [Halomicroarcula nitratireducens]MBX0296754.1 hypothetical protein [Halomicroarcula nitratireducens]